VDGYDMLREVAELGYEYVELSHGIRVSLVPGIVKAVSEGVVKVSSLHNFCPLPIGVMHAAPNLYQPTATEHRERELWFKHTKRTLDFAVELGANRMVTHGGSVKLFWDGILKKLIKYRMSNLERDLVRDMEYAPILQKALEKVRKKAEFANKILIHCLEQIAPEAQKRDIKIGLENRDGFKELPMDADFPSVLSHFKDSGVIGYWHDSGHGAIKSQFGIIDYNVHIEQNAEFMLGMHLKDATLDGQENLAIGTGYIDFKFLSQFFKDDMVLTVEVGPNIEVAEIISSREYLEALIS
jgi:sugar phosphate isomerase/epimerase